MKKTIALGLFAIIFALTAFSSVTNPCMPISSEIISKHRTNRSIELSFSNLGKTVADFDKSSKAVLAHLSQNGFKNPQLISNDYSKGVKSYMLYFKGQIDMTSNKSFCDRNKNPEKTLVSGSAFVNFSPAPVMGVVKPEFIINQKVYVGEMTTKRLKNLLGAVKTEVKVANNQNWQIAKELANGKPIIEKFCVIYGSERYRYTFYVVTQDKTYSWSSGYFDWDVIPQWGLGDEDLLDATKYDCKAEDFPDVFLSEFGFRINYSLHSLSGEPLGIIR